MKEESRQSAIPLSSRVSTLVCDILKLHIWHDAAQRFSAYQSVLTKCVSSNSPRWTSTERRRARDETPCRPRIAKNDLLPTLLPGERLVAKTRHRYWSLGRVQLLLLSRLLTETPARLLCLLFLSSHGGWQSPEVTPGHTRDSSRLGQTLRSAQASARDEKLFYDHQKGLHSLRVNPDRFK